MFAVGPLVGKWIPTFPIEILKFWQIRVQNPTVGPENHIFQQKSPRSSPPCHPLCCVPPSRSAATSQGKYSNGFCHWPQPAWVKPDGTWQPSTTNFTSLADPAAVGSGRTALVTLMHEAGHAAHFANIVQPSPLFSQERAPTSVAYAETQSMFLDSLCKDAAWRGRYARSRDGAVLPWELHAADITATHPYEVCCGHIHRPCMPLPFSVLEHRMLHMVAHGCMTPIPFFCKHLWFVSSWGLAVPVSLQANIHKRLVEIVCGATYRIVWQPFAGASCITKRQGKSFGRVLFVKDPPPPACLLEPTNRHRLTARCRPLNVSSCQFSTNRCQFI